MQKFMKHQSKSSAAFDALLVKDNELTIAGLVYAMLLVILIKLIPFTPIPR
jgi:hypothetical protein